MTEYIVAWSILILGFALPLLHVALSPMSGRWRPPEGSRCPLGPRTGWLVPVGWLLYMRGRTRHAHGTRA